MHPPTHTLSFRGGVLRRGPGIQVITASLQPCVIPERSDGIQAIHPPTHTLSFRGGVLRRGPGIQVITASLQTCVIPERSDGIQAFRLMPPEGVDTDAVCIDPRLDRNWDWLFPQGLDSGSPRAGARFPGMTLWVWVENVLL